MVKLTAEQLMAVEQHPEGVQCQDASSRRTYVLMDADLHRRAMMALNQLEDLAAVQRGLDDVSQGNTMSVDESQARLLQKLQRSGQ